MMRILYIILYACCFSINFELQNQSISINIEGEVLEKPFTGGINYARIAWQDWDNDGDIDLFLLDEDQHFRYFENSGNTTNYEFNLSYHPIQELSGINWFFLHDFDNDNVLELATQSTANPSHVMYFDYIDDEFIFISLLYQNTGDELISSAVMTPTFADIDNDGDFDFFTGNTSGTVNYFENIGSDDGLPVFEFISSFWEDILIVGPSQNRHGASAINFIDLDGDSDLDLAWGDYFQRSLYVIWNEGNAEQVDMNPDNFLYQFPENNPIYTSGQNMPSFADIDGDSDMDLFITILGGDGPVQLNNNFLMYENIGTSSDPDYYHTSDNFLGSLDLLSNVVPEFADIDDDGDLDFFVGQDFTTISNPTMGRIYQFEHEEIFEITLTLLDSMLLGDQIGLSLHPEFIDIDSDEDLDLFVGDYNGRISYFENIGSSSHAIFSDQQYLENIDLSFFSAPEFCDIDSDGDYDLFIGSNSGGLDYFENIGTSFEYSFLESDFILPDINHYTRTAFEFIDLDYDMDYDLLVGTDKDGLLIYWNLGTQETHNFVRDGCLDIPYFGHNIKVAAVQLNNDSNDLIIGLSTGGFLHYRFDIRKKGDVIIDSIIDILDIVAMVNYILFSNNELDCNIDFNHDNSVDVNDIILIVNMILG